MSLKHIDLDAALRRLAGRRRATNG